MLRFTLPLVLFLLLAHTSGQSLRAQSLGAFGEAPPGAWTQLPPQPIGSAPLRHLPPTAPPGLEHHLVEHHLVHAPISYRQQQPDQGLEQRLFALEEALRQMEEPEEEPVDYPTQRWTGRIHTDYWAFPSTDEGSNFFERGDPDLPVQDRFLFRRLRLGMLGEVSEVMLYKIEFDFAEGNDLAIKDAYLGFQELPLLQTVLIGNQKRPYGLDHLNSSRFNLFIERPFIVEALNQDARRLGITSYGVTDDLAYNWRLGTYLSADIQDTGLYLASDDPGRNHYQAELAGRFANTIWYDETSDGRGYAHWAVAGTIAGTDGSAGAESTARFRTRPEARTSARWLDTGTIVGARNYEILALESVLNLGPLQVVGEFMQTWVQRDAGNPDVAFHGGYIYISYFLTGEHVPWDRESGTIDRVVPFENFFLVRTCDGRLGHGWGAWQVGLRLSYADLTDADILGGVGNSITAGMNWIWTPYSRMQFNYVYGEIEDRFAQRISSATGLPAGPVGPTEGDYHILGVRMAIDF